MKVVEHKLSDLLIALENGGRPAGGVASITNGVPSIGGEHLTPDGGFDFSKLKYIPETYFRNLRRGHIQENDVLVVKDGATTGKTSFVSREFPFNQAAVNEHVFILRADTKKVLPKFLFYFLYSPLGQKQVLANYRGAAIGGINQSFSQNTIIPLPSLAEQERIVCLVDEAEALRKLRGEAGARMEEFVPALFYKMFGDLITIPKKWNIGVLSELCQRVIDCPHATPVFSNIKTEYACIRSSDIQNGYLDWSKTKYVNYSEYSKRILRGTPTVGDVLYCREGARFGNAALIPEGLDKKICLGQRMMLFRPNDTKATSEFLWATLDSNSIYQQAERLVGGSASPHVNVQDIKAFRVIIPPIELQREFSQRVQEAQEIRARQVQSVERIEALYQSMLSRAFAGEL